jgi:hypothetical protein
MIDQDMITKALNLQRVAVFVHGEPAQSAGLVAIRQGVLTRISGISL